MNNPYVLAFDCSTPVASVAVLAGDRLVRRDVPVGKQAALLVPTIEDAMTEAGIGYAQLGMLVSTVGPGSFTGLRIGLATLHGLALATGLPVKTLTASCAVAWAVDAPEFLVALHAGKGEMFMQHFRREATQPPQSLGEITLAPHADLHAQTLPCYSNLWPTEHAYYMAGPDAAVMAHIAGQLSETTLAQAMPYYIREADAKIPQKPSWLVN